MLHVKDAAGWKQTGWVEEPVGQITDPSYLFHNWRWLKSAPMLDIATTLTVQNMFNNCTSLTTVPLYNTGSVTNMQSMFYSCTKLTAISLTDCSKVTSAVAWPGCASLTSCLLPSLTRGLTLTNTSMDATAINALFTSLGTANGAQTINVTGAPGYATCNKSIATAKGWTVA